MQNVILLPHTKISPPGIKIPADTHEYNTFNIKAISVVKGIVHSSDVGLADFSKQSFVHSRRKCVWAA